MLRGAYRVAKTSDSRDTFATGDSVLLLRVNRLDYVPSGLYSAELLCEKGHRVLALEYGYFQKHLEQEPGKIPRLRLGHPWARRLPQPIASVVLPLCTLVRLCLRFLRDGRPKLIISEGLHEQVLSFFLSILFRVPYVCHVHEVFEFAHARGWNKAYLACEGAVLRGAKLTVFPEKDRASVYRQRYGLDVPQYIAYNCPRKRSPALAVDWRGRLGLPSQARLLGYWGGQGRTNALEQGIRAVARLPNTYFLLWGWSSPADRTYFKNLASGVGAGHRILFLGELPADKWAAIAGLDASYCVYEPVELRFRHLATASNKLMESLAAGVPVLTSNERDFRDIVDFYGVGVCAQGFSVDAIHLALRELLDDEPGLSRRGENALRAHREGLNYEYQYQPVLRALGDLLEV